VLAYTGSNTDENTQQPEQGRQTKHRAEGDSMTQKKRILIGVSAVALIALIAGLVWWFMPPDKNDFAAAKTTAEKIKEYKGTTLFREYAAAVSTANKEGKSYEQIIEATSSQKTKLLDALDSRSENAEKLKSSRVLRDKDVEAAYATYESKEKKYESYLRGYAEAYPSYTSSFRTCGEVFQITKQTQDLTAYAGLHRQAAQSCLKDLSVLSKTSIKPLAEYAKEFIRIVNGRQKAFDGIADKTIDPSSASTTIQELGAAVTKNDPTEELTALSKDTSFNGELDSLIKVLGKKAEQAK
jgi:type IV secretory pathway VirB10-like protein